MTPSIPFVSSRRPSSCASRRRSAAASRASNVRDKWRKDHRSCAARRRRCRRRARRGELPARAFLQPHPRRRFSLPRPEVSHSPEIWPATRARCTARAGWRRGNAAQQFERGAELRFATSPANGRGATRRARSSRSTSSGLGLASTCRNLSDEPMPCGLGQHPYFPCTPETRLDTRVEPCLDDRRAGASGREGARPTGRYDLRDRRVCGQGLDHGFGGWGGSARIADPALPFEIEMSSPDARFFQLYSPRGGRPVRRRAGQPRQCRAQRAGGAMARSSGCGCWSRARRWR